MIGIDVGGANLKIVDGDGVHIHYCPLWTGSPLTRLLAQYRKKSSEPAAVVMSGELADCFSGKAEGIAYIMRAVQEVFPSALFYGTDAAFHAVAVPQLAAANWLASADYLREQYPDSVLVDVGSTTTDIIPLPCFADLKGLTDLRRLQKGYLLYTGMLRTTLPALVRTFDIDGTKTPGSSEYFAISADAHLVLGHITPEEYSCDTPDKKGKTENASLRRLSRVVCADLEEIGEQNAIGIASQFWDAQRTLVCDRVRAVMKESGASSVVTAGTGAALFAKELSGTDLSDEIGPFADALPAYAVREVAARENVPESRSRRAKR
ncbi:MAG: H4MPT-linked C1 transfer pathway protein [Methanoregula sp.]|nr:MAG: H4MPT-linked C1 transfer pathway protein [Methanoregula sp.]